MTKAQKPEQEPTQTELRRRTRGRRIRVLITSSTFPLELDDGSPAFVFDLADALGARAEVTALVPAAHRRPRSETMGRVAVERFTYFLPRRLQTLAYGDGMGSNLRGSWGARLQVPSYLLSQVVATRRLLQSREFDVVNSHWLLPQGLSTGLALGRRRRVPHVVTVHGGDAYLLRRLSCGPHLARFIVGRADLLIAVSRDIRDCLDDLLGRPSGAVVQPMGVGLPGLAATSDSAGERRGEEEYVLFVGRLHRIKGVDDLLLAFQTVLRDLPDLRLVIAGDGREGHALKRKAETLGIARSVSFLGRQPRSSVTRLLRHCRLAVVPSIVSPGGRTEGTPMVLLEAMSLGAPVVATRVGGIPDVLEHGESGWLCRPADPQDLARTLLEALRSERTAAITARALGVAQSYDLSVVAGRYLQAFGELAAADSTSGPVGPQVPWPGLGGNGRREAPGRRE